MFHQYEMFQKITLFGGEIAKPMYLGVKGDQSLISNIILRSTSHIKNI